MKPPLQIATPGAAGDWAAPTNQTLFVGAAHITSRPYKKIEPLLKIIFYIVWTSDSFTLKVCYCTCYHNDCRIKFMGGPQS